MGTIFVFKNAWLTVCTIDLLKKRKGNFYGSYGYRHLLKNIYTSKVQNFVSPKQRFFKEKYWYQRNLSKGNSRNRTNPWFAAL